MTCVSSSTSDCTDCMEFPDCLATPNNNPLLQTGPLHCIQCTYSADVYKFLFVGQHWLLVSAYFSSSVPHVLFISLGLFVRWAINGSIGVDLRSFASQICSKPHAEFLCSSSFFSMCFVNVYVVHPYRSNDAATVWKKSRLVLWEKSDFHLIGSRSIVSLTFAKHVLSSLSVDEILLPKYMN